MNSMDQQSEDPPGPETPQIPDHIQQLVGDTTYVLARRLFLSRRWEFYHDFQLDAHNYRDESEDYSDDRRQFWNDRHACLRELGEFLSELEEYAEGNERALANVAQWRILESSWRAMDAAIEAQDNLQGPLYHQNREMYWITIENARSWIEALWREYHEVAPTNDHYEERVLHWDECWEHWVARMTSWRESETYWNERAQFWEFTCEVWYERNPAPILLDRARFGHILLQWDFEPLDTGDYYSITWFDFLLTNLGFDYDPEDPEQPHMLFEELGFFGLEFEPASPQRVRQNPHPALVAIPTATMTADVLREGESTAECIVCLDEIAMGDHILFMPFCTHFFHSQCILDWSEWPRTCPVCRRTFDP